MPELGAPSATIEFSAEEGLAGESSSLAGQRPVLPAMLLVMVDDRIVVTLFAIVAADPATE